MPLVRSHMSRTLLTVEPGLTAREAAQEMVAHNVGSALVLEDGALAGILTERDLMRALAKGLRDGATVDELMTRDPDTIGPEDSVEHAATLMIHGGFRHVPVVDGEQVVGMLSVRDLMKVVLADAAPRGV